MKQSKVTQIIFITLVLGGLGWLIHLIKDKNFLSSEEKQEYGKVTRIDLIQRVTIAGNVIPKRKTIVTAPFNGYIKKLYVKVGQKVKKGDPIVSIVQSLQSSDPIFPLRAPFDGTIVTVNRHEGEFVKKDSAKEFILRIDNLGQLYIVSNVPEIDMVKIKLGQEAIIKASAILNKEYKGIIEEISLASRQQDGWRGNSKVEFPTKIRIVNKDKKIRPGMSTILDIITFKKEKILSLAHEFILREKEKFFVILKNGERKEIKIGIQNESSFEILEGVVEGQEVRQVDFMELLSKKDL